MKKRSFRDTLKFYLIDCKTPLGKFIDLFIIFLNILIIGLLVIETYSISEKLISVLWKIEIVTVFFLIIEYIARLYASEKRLKHTLGLYSIIDLLAILPTIAILLFPVGVGSNIAIFKIIRAIRVFRIFRFLRFTKDSDFFFGKTTVSILKVIQLMVTIVTILFISSGLFYVVENQINENVNNFGDALYYTVVSITTVGFGDILPVSELGRWVTILMILSGIILIPWKASQIIKEWIKISSKARITCKKCGLKFHDKDASHCKACGNLIYQEYDGV